MKESDQFYKVLAVKRDQHIFFSHNQIRVDLDAALVGCPQIKNDRQFLEATQPDVYFWVSGGGTYLLNNKFLIVVERSRDSKVNAGQLSLFTGRADSVEEWSNLPLLKRELFEELWLIRHDKLLKPADTRCQPMIDAIYDKFLVDRAVERLAEETIEISPHDLADTSVFINIGNLEKQFRCNYRVAQNGDINVLWFYKVQTDLDGLSGVDGEYQMLNGQVSKQSRRLFLYDWRNESLIRFDGPDRSVHDARSFRKSENLLAAVLVAEKQMAA